MISAPIIQYSREPYLISTDRAKLNLQSIYEFLVFRSYWAQNRNLDMVQTSLDNSLCFGVYLAEAQVGFGRVVTDYATFGWICDVFIMENHRGQGLGKWLVNCICQHPQLVPIRRIILATVDAHSLYQKHAGFQPLLHPERWLEQVKNQS